MPRKLKAYIVWYSQRSRAKVKAFSISGARLQAWNMLGGFKHGWTKADFLKKATTQRI